MRAALYRRFAGPITIENIPDPTPPADGVVVRVMATGVCRSDWHGWQGHDAAIDLPHVPGHELAGVVAAVGNEVENWSPGDRVTVPFVAGCGSCDACRSGNPQVCPDQYQPGFTGWGSFAELVALRYADENLVELPDDIEFSEAAALGCRFMTAFRAVRDQGRLVDGEWAAVYGCGGVGLSAIMIAVALGGRVVAVDPSEDARRLARELGAEIVIDPTEVADVADAVQNAIGGAHLSIDALGSPATCRASVLSLRARGRHVQVGLLPDGATPLPMDRVVAAELEILGSHGMPAHHFPALLEMIRVGKLRPGRIVGRRIALEEAPAALMRMGETSQAGITVIDRLDSRR
jgi:alcohol dehydrogenase